MNKTCLQCGAVLPSGSSACSFCDSIYQPKLPPPDRASLLSRCDLTSDRWEESSNPEVKAIYLPSNDPANAPVEVDQPSTWRGELADRLEAYRVKRRKGVAPEVHLDPPPAQSRLPFAEPATPASPAPPNMSEAYALAVAIAEPPERAEDEFSFTIAIGRIAVQPPSEARTMSADGRMMIDVSSATDEIAFQDETAQAAADAHEGLYPVASMYDRRIAGLIDAACLLFACGGFLALFGSMGGHFALNKLSFAVYVTALAVVYCQYFALFTVFGGTTPGMMFRGLQVASFSGEPPTPRQMLLRSAGYMLSAATFFMGFLWAFWDEDELTWHDRFSRTFISSAQTYAEIQSHTAAHHPH